MRVNVLDVKYLSDQHLVAEYREVKMGPPLLSRILKSKKGLDKSKIPNHYKLGKGHSYFFLDKNLFLKKRLVEITKEMKRRGIKTESTKFIKDKNKLDKGVFIKEYWKDYIPDNTALKINLDRIEERISSKKPGWYKFWKKPIRCADDTLLTRTANKYIECNNCNAINITQHKCWKCKNDLKNIKYSSYF